MKAVVSFLFLLVAIHSFGAGEVGLVLDRLTVKGGAVLVGEVQSVEATVLYLKTDYAGVIPVDLSRVERVTLTPARELGLPAALVAAAPAPVAKGTPAPAAAPKPKAPPPPPNGWSLRSGINLTGKQGNNDRFDLVLTAEAEFEREKDRFNLYGKYSYGTNRGVQSADESILGGRYTAFPFEKAGFFARQEFERDDFEGIGIRSTSATGFSYRFRNEDHLRLETRIGVSYRYEDYRDDGREVYPGMDLGLDLNWRFVEWARFKGAYTFLPSVEGFEEFILRQESGLVLPLDKKEFWNIELGVTSHYNNRPDFGREKLDMSFYARFVTSWK